MSMVFGLFSRKSTLDDTSASPDPKTDDKHTRLPTPTPSAASISYSPLRFPTSLRGVLGGSTTDLTLKDSDLATVNVARAANYVHSLAQPPPVIPSPSSGDSDETKALYDLMLTIPAKTLHAYTLSHLRPQVPLPSASVSALGSLPDVTPGPPSPTTVTKLTTFFSTLAPPPLLHCVRCHEDFYDIQNEAKDKACRVPHDDDSALLSRISGGGFETHWGCCGQTTPGDGSEGGPDGWCYEGTHTVDVKRARFREDSTAHDDKLISCFTLNCRGIRERFPRPSSLPSPLRNGGMLSARKSEPSPTRSRASVVITTTRKRLRKSLKDASSSENEADVESTLDRGVEVKGGNVPQSHGGSETAIDEPSASSKPKVKSKSRPISRTRPKPSSLASPLLPTSHSNTTTPVSAKTRTSVAKPKSISRTILSQSHTHLASDSEVSNHSRPRTRSHVREESRARPTSKLTKVDISERPRRSKTATKPVTRSPGSGKEQSDEHEESDSEERGRDRKKRRVGRA